MTDVLKMNPHGFTVLGDEALTIVNGGGEKLDALGQIVGGVTIWAGGATLMSASPAAFAVNPLLGAGTLVGGGYAVYEGAKMAANGVVNLWNSIF